MSELITILAFSTILWYLIEQGKTAIWGTLAFHKWVTIGVAAIGAFTLTFSFNLDIVSALQVAQCSSLAGKILTGFILMSGSSAVAEIIESIKGIKG